jgi:hypothetical protein
MKLRNLIVIAAVTLLPLAAQAATIVVPAAGTGPGANNSLWQSELTLHTVAPRAVSLEISLHQGTTVLGPVQVTLQPRQTLSIADVARTQFGLSSGTGALVIELADRDAKSLAVTSRTFNVSPVGEFGQDIPAVRLAEASGAGDIAVITGPSTSATNRFNFGVFTPEAATIRWDIVRGDGSTAGSREISYAAGEHAQYNNGVATMIGTGLRDNDAVHARIIDGKAIVYGSIVNATGDPTFVPGIRTRDDILIQFVGLDLNEDGIVDVFDADGDQVLDTPVQVVTSLFPAYFRIVAEGEFGEELTYEIVSSPTRSDLLDARGTLRVIAHGDVKGTNGALLVRATSGNSSAVLTIPLLFK